MCLIEAGALRERCKRHLGNPRNSRLRGFFKYDPPNLEGRSTEIRDRLSSLESEFGTYMDNGEDGEEWFEKN